MKVDLNRNCGMSLYLKNDMKLTFKNTDEFELDYKKGYDVQIFMNKNDCLFKDGSDDITTLEVDEKSNRIKFNIRRDDELKFNDYSYDDNYELSIYDIIDYGNVGSSSTKTQPFINNLSLYNLEMNDKPKSLLVFNVKDDNHVSTKSLILDATLLDEAEYTVIRELEQDEIDELGFKPCNNIIDDSNMSSFYNKYKIPIIISTVIVAVILCLLLVIVIIRYYKNNTKKNSPINKLVI